MTTSNKPITTIKSEWDRYISMTDRSNMTLIGDGGARRIIEKAFYAGAVVMMQIMVNQLPELDEAEAQRAIQKLGMEASEFAAGVIEETATKMAKQMAKGGDPLSDQASMYEGKANVNGGSKDAN